MSNVSTSIGSAASAQQTLARVADVLGAIDSTRAAVANRPSTVGEFVQKVKASSPEDVKDGIGTVAGAAVGAYFWKEHRVLGLIGGASLGRNVPALLNAEQRRYALVNMGITSSGVLAAMSMGKGATKTKRFVAFAAGWLAAGAAVHIAGLRK